MRVTMSARTILPLLLTAAIQPAALAFAASGGGALPRGQNRKPARISGQAYRSFGCAVKAT